MLPAAPLLDVAAGPGAVNVALGLLSLAGVVYTAHNARRLGEWMAEKQADQKREEARLAGDGARDAQDEAERARVERSTWALIAVLQADNAALRKRLDELEGRGKGTPP